MKRGLQKEELTMPDRKINLNELKGRTLDEVLREIVQTHEQVTIILEDGQAVEIRPMELKPLPELEGSVPDGWKDGIYAR
jgi:hypothetical protein